MLGCPALFVIVRHGGSKVIGIHKGVVSSVWVVGIPSDAFRRQRFKGVKTVSEAISLCGRRWSVCSRLSERQ